MRLAIKFIAEFMRFLEIQNDENKIFQKSLKKQVFDFEIFVNEKL